MADQFPSLYRLAEVATIDVYAAPDVASDLVTTWAAAFGEVEAIAASGDGKWLRIATPYGESWVFREQLEPKPGSNDLRSCQGEAPGWYLEQRGTTVFLDIFDGYLYVLDKLEYERGLRAASDDGELAISVSASICHHPVSDVQRGLTATGRFKGFGAAISLNGCCSLKP